MESTWKKGLFIITMTTTLVTFFYIQKLKPFEIMFIQHLREHGNSSHVVTSVNGTNSSPSNFLCHKMEGQMGNAMFKFASVYGIARSLNMRPVITGLKELKQKFKISSYVLEDNSLCQNIAQITEHKACSYDERFINMKRSFKINGYLQSWFYFKSVSSEIRKQFQFKNDTVTKATKRIREALLSKYGHGVFKQIRIGAHILVGLHVRRGDQLNKAQKDFGVRVPDNSFVPRAQKFYRDRYSNVTFLVCSDDFHWTKNATDDRDDVIFMEGNAADVDMCILSQTNHTIYTIGTFGWWAGWLANGTVVYWKDYAQPNTNLGAHYSLDRKDYVLPGWVGLS